MNINDDVKQNITGILLALRTKGIEKISATKLLLLINDKHRIELDMDSLAEVLSDNKAIAEMNGDQIILGSPASDIEQNNDDFVRDTATQQASDNLTKESVSKYKKILESFDGIYVGQEIELKNAINESVKDFHLLNGIKKSKTKLIVEELDTSKLRLRCKIKDKNIFVYVPISLIK